MQVERDFESEATVVAWTDADPGSDPRAACVEVAAAGDAEQRRLEAGCESDCEQLLWICSGPVVTPERYRDRKIDFEATVTRAAVALAAAFNDGRLFTGSVVAIGHSQYSA